MKRTILFLLLQSCSWAGTYYIDPGARYNGDGSLGTPALGPRQPGAFNAWPQYPKRAGDRYFQKCGTTFVVPWQNGVYLGNIDGSAEDETVLGAYYLDASNKVVPGVSGDKPIMTGLTDLTGWNDPNNWSNLGNNIWEWQMGSVSPYRLWIDGTERLMAGFNPNTENANPEGIIRIDPRGNPATYWCHESYPPEGGGDSGQTLFLYSPGNPASTYSSMQSLQAIDRILTIRDSDHVIVENLDLRAAKTCLFIDRSNFITIQDCDIGKGGQTGISIRGTSIEGVALTANQGVIRRCLLDADFHFPGYKYEDQGPQYGIELLDGSNNWDIYQNDIRNWGHTGVNIFALENSPPAMNSNDNKVHENYFTAPEASHCRAFNLTGSASGRCSDNEIYLNYIYRMPTQSQISADHNKIYDNIFDTMTNGFYYLHDETWQTSGAGLQLWAGGDNDSCVYNKIYHNVFYNTGEAALRLIVWGHNQTVQNNEIVNNIMYNCGLAANSGRESFRSGEYAGAALVVEAWRAEDDAGLSHNIVRNNLIYNSGTCSNVRYKGSAMTVFTFNGHAQDGDTIAGNLQSCPRFFDPASGDFALLPHSGAIGHGYDLGECCLLALTPGMTRRHWPGAIATSSRTAPWDIGPFEYGPLKY